MSPINFAVLRDECPDLSNEWDKLEAWFSKQSQPAASSVDYVTLSRLEGIDKLRLVLALNEMVERDMVRRVYHVRSPGGPLLEGEFDSLTDIPSELPTRDYSQMMPVDHERIVNGYRWESVHAA